MYVCMFMCMYVHSYMSYVLVLGLISISHFIQNYCALLLETIIADTEVNLRGELRGKAAVLVHSPSSNSASSR